MSNDELLPGSETPPVTEEAVRSAQEPSDAAAPPAAPPRRRRAKAAGTDAAAVPDPSATESPARASRSRRKPAPPETDVPAPGAESLTADTPAPPAPRRRRVAAKVDAPAAEPPAEASSQQEPPGEERPRVRSRRRARGEETTGDANSEAQAPLEAAPPISEPASLEPDSPVRGARSRSRRKPPAAAEALPEAEAGPPPPSEQPAAQGDDNATAERTRRRRSTRSRRRGAEADEPVAEPEAAQSAEAIAEPPPTEPEGTGRTRRRGGRGRKPRVAESADADSPGEGASAESEMMAPPEPEPVVDRGVGAHLITRNGLPEITIDGVFHAPLLFFGNLDSPENRQRVLAEVRRAAAAGVHLHSTLVELPCPLSEASHALDEIDGRLRAILEADPDGYVMPRIVFVPGRGWKREYPTDIAAYADGTTGDPSLTSARFWQEAESSLATLINHLREHAWGRRVFGYHLERGEWFQSADQGFDRSVANRDAFRDWLRVRYRDSLVGLRGAWYDGEVQFHTAEIPPMPARTNPQRAFFETRRERRIIDFFEFTSESTAQRLIALSRTVKQAAGHSALVSVCYGYTFEFGHGFSGHLALGLLEAAPTIDLICGPPSYRDREGGGAASLPAPVDSPPLHGKLWLTEDDTKTFLAPAQQDPEDFNPRLPNLDATLQAMARMHGKTLAHGAGLGFMDLWGEGWLGDEALWSAIGSLTRRYNSFQKSREYPRVPEVVALIDERSLLHVQHGEPFFRRLTNGLRATLQHAGISFGLYLQSDLTSANFPTDARLYLFLTPFRLPAEQRDAIKEKLQNGSKTLAWLYAPGSCEERPSIGGILEEGTNGTVGMTLRPQEWNSEIGSRIVDTRHPLFERVTGREIGARERLNPSYYVADESAKILAEYVGSGLPSIAVKEHSDWSSVFLGEPVLPLELLRGLCRYAGAHVWTPQNEDVVSVGSGWVTVHAENDGPRTLRLPDALALYDVTDSRLIADETREHRFQMKAGETRTFAVGNSDRFLALELPDFIPPGSGRARIVGSGAPASRPPDTARTERPERPERSERPERAETRPGRDPRTSNLPPPPSIAIAPSDEERRLAVETLRAIIAADPLEIEAVALSPELELASIELTDTQTTPLAGVTTPLAGDLESDINGNGRKRRRRGGRGRGRNRPGDGADPSAEGTSDPPVDGLAPDRVPVREPASREEFAPVSPPPAAAEPAERAISLPEPFRFHDDAEPD